MGKQGTKHNFHKPCGNSVQVKRRAFYGLFCQGLGDLSDNYGDYEKLTQNRINKI